jgi:hypothetical protein
LPRAPAPRACPWRSGAVACDEIIARGPMIEAADERGAFVVAKGATVLTQRRESHA